jgi:uncharacterized tellurite resistance protein B-like protein
MITADRQVNSREIAIAEGIGNTLFDNFDSVEFRAVISNPKDIPDLQKLSALLGEILTSDGKRAVYDYVKSIAEADGDVDQAERDILDRLASAWSLEQSSI